MFRIRFSGHCLPDFDEAQVRATLERQGTFTARQLRSIFRGRPVTLKRGLTKEQASRYCDRLRHIGMDVAAELDPNPEGNTEIPLIEKGSRQPAPFETPLPTLTVELGTATVITPEAAAANATAAGILAPEPLPKEPAPPAPTAPTLPPENSTLRKQHRTSNPAERICPRCSSIVAAALPCPFCLGKPLQAPVSAPVAPPPNKTPEAKPAKPAPAPVPPQTSIPAPIPTPPVPVPPPVSSKTQIRPPAASAAPAPVRKAIHIPTDPGPESLADLMQAQVRHDNRSDRSTYFDLSFSGRMNSLHYLWLACLNCALVGLVDALQFAQHIMAFNVLELIAAGLGVLALLQGTRLTILRLHDTGHSAYWAGAYLTACLACSLIGSPWLAQALFGLGILLFAVLPAQERNRHGWPPAPATGLLAWFEGGPRQPRLAFLIRILGCLNAAVLLNTTFMLLVFFLNLILPTGSFKHILNPVVTGSAFLLFAGGLTIRQTSARLHDIGFSARWAILCYVLPVLPYLLFEAGYETLGAISTLLANAAAAVIFLTLLFLPGQIDRNRFGTPPIPTLINKLWGPLALCALLYGTLFAFGLWRILWVGLI